MPNARILISKETVNELIKALHQAYKADYSVSKAALKAALSTTIVWIT